MDGGTGLKAGLLYHLATLRACLGTEGELLVRRLDQGIRLGLRTPCCHELRGEG